MGHDFFELSLELYRITFNRHSGATALSVLIRSILLFPVIPNLLVLIGVHLFHQLLFSGEYFEHVRALSRSPWDGRTQLFPSVAFLQAQSFLGNAC